MSFIYETHSHTCQASACGKVRGKDYIDYMQREGYAGMIITDHFFNGNCCVPRCLPWKEKIEMFMSGYEDARKAAEGTDFNVMFGIEYNFDGDEYLIYGVDKKWLLDNEDIMGKDRYEVHALVKEAGAIMFQAHPYRERDYIKTINLTPGVSDGIEICNAANDDNMNALAYCYAKELGVPVSAGSDIHIFYKGPKAGMMFEEKITDIYDYVSKIMSGQGIPVVLSDGKATPVNKIEGLMIPKHGPNLQCIRK